MVLFESNIKKKDLSHILAIAAKSFKLLFYSLVKYGWDLQTILSEKAGLVS